MTNKNNILPGTIRFNIWDDGDHSVGISGSQSIVETYIQDEEHLESIRECLKECFDTIHDFYVRVMTDGELKEDSEE